MGHCPTVALADVYAAAFDLWHAGRRQEAFDMFGRILAFNSMGGSGRESVLIVRGVFKPTVQFRTAPPTPSADATPETGAGARAAPAADAAALVADAEEPAADAVALVAGVVERAAAAAELVVAAQLEQAAAAAGRTWTTRKSARLSTIISSPT